MSIVSLLAMWGTCSFAQPPGSWIKVPLGSYVPIDFSFSDSLNGILLCHPEGTSATAWHPPIVTDFITTDGGRSWNQENQCAGFYFLDGLVYPGLFASPKRGWGFFADTPDRSSSIEPIIVNDSLFLQACGPLGQSPGQKMYDTLDGVRLVCPEDSLIHIKNYQQSIGYYGAYYLISTHDAWRTYNYTNTSLVYPSVSGDTAYIVSCAKILDSNNIWLCAGIDDTSGMKYEHHLMHSTDGKTWTSIYPAGTPDSSSWFWVDLEFAMSKRLEYDQATEMYVQGGEVNIDSTDTFSMKGDFAFSNDSGITWEIDSSFSGRLYRLSPTSPGVVWCIVGQGPQISPYMGWQGENHDSLYYSSDHGRNAWLIDSTTFLNEYMIEMHWIDPNHGFIAAVDDAGGYMYRYEASTDGVTQLTKQPNPLRSYPNPFSEFTTIGFTSTASGLAQLKIYNLLGEEVAQLFEGEIGEGEHSFNWDPAKMADGMYECVLRQAGVEQRIPIILLR